MPFFGNQRKSYSNVNIINDKSTNEWENIVDGIVYINLDTRPDRKVELLENLKTYNIPSSIIHRIPAVYEKMCGYVGCSKSHIKALEYAERQNWKRFLVLEDDFIFTESKSNIINNISKFYKDYNFDCLMLAKGHLITNDTEIPYIKRIEYCTTASGYIVPKHYIQTLKENLNEGLIKLQEEVVQLLDKNPNKKIYNTVYANDQYWNVLQKQDNWYLITVGKQSGTYSTIMGSI